MGVSLSKGQTISLAKSSPSTLTRVRMGLGWDAMKIKKLFGGYREQEIDLDASCLMFDGAKQSVDAVWWNQLASKDGSITHTGDNRTGDGDGDDESIIVDLTAVAANVQHLVFVVSSYSGETFSQIENAFCRLVDESTGTELARFDLTGSGAHTAQIMAKLTRNGDSWDMTAIGTTGHGRTIGDLIPAAVAGL